MQRMGMMIGIKPERIPEYKEIHANCWPEIRRKIAECNIKNYSIFLREPENVMFGYWEYHGTDFKADMARMAEDEATKRWWALCEPMQAPLESRDKGEWWAMMEEVFHQD